MEMSYGRLLKEARKAAGKTLKDVASFLNVSAPYVFDVEKDRRNGWSTERTLAVAAYLNVNPQPLIEAAARQMGGVWIPLASSDAASLAALARAWPSLSDAERAEISAILARR